MSDITNAKTSQVETTAVFLDGADVTHSDLEVNVVTRSADKVSGHERSELNRILGRPVRVAHFTWSHGTKENTSVDPWNSYFNNSIVASICDNYSLFRASMRVKVVMNGTPFHRGRLLVGYRPSFQASSMWNGTVGFTEPMYDSVVSQLPGTLERPMAPNKSDIFEMTLPFFFDSPYARVANIKAGTESLGTLLFKSPINLTTANGNTVNATYSVFAWLENIELIVPVPLSSGGSGKVSAKGQLADLASSAIAKITEDNDEYKPDGVVSSVTSAFAEASGALKNVPLIGQFMGPTQNALNMVTNAAKFFGFSRPPVVTDPVLYRNLPFSYTNYIDGSEALVKLTYDPKQELSVDPGIAGIGSADEMAFMAMTRHWSLLTTFPWSVSDVAGTRLFEILVNPYMIQAGTSTGLKDIRHLTSVTQGVYPFNYWRGGLEYMFVVACSQYDTGRLAFTFDPTGVNHQPLTSNAQYVQYMDIKENDELMLGVHWAQGEAYKLIPDMSTGELYSTLGVVYNSGFANGSLRVSVLNDLITPTGTGAISILVFVRGATDLEWRAPKEEFSMGSTIQLYPEALSMTGVGKELAPFVGTSDEDDEALRLKVFFGEKVPSLRALLRRYIMHVQTGSFVVTASGPTRVDFCQGAFPGPFSDYLPSFWTTAGWSNTVGSEAYTGPLQFYRVCYAAWRGGLKRKVAITTGSSTRLGFVAASRDATQITGSNFLNSSNSTWPATNNVLSIAGYSDKIYSGSYVTMGDQQAVVEYEVPFYTNKKFHSTSLLNLWVNTADEAVHASRVIIMVGDSNSAGYSVNATAYAAAGDDFSYIWYLGGGTYRVI